MKDHVHLSNSELCLIRQGTASLRNTLLRKLRHHPDDKQLLDRLAEVDDLRRRTVLILKDREVRRASN